MTTTAVITTAQRKALQTIADHPCRVIAWQRTAAGFLTINGNVENSLSAKRLITAVYLDTVESTTVPGQTYDRNTWELTDAGREALATHTGTDEQPGIEPESQNTRPDSETAPTAKTNKAATRAVIRNLTKSTGMHREAWESLQSGSVEEFRADAISHLGDKSNLRTATLESADWAEVYAHFYDTAEPSQNLVGETTPGEPVHPAGALIGYARVSTGDQDAQLQLDALKAAGCVKVFTDTASGKSTNGRPELAKTMEYLRPGDALVVWKLDRFARSLIDLVTTVDALAARGVGFKVLTGALANIDPQTPDGRLMLQVIGAMAEFERSLIVERTRAGLATARAEGRVGGRPTVIDEDKLAAARARRDKGESVTSIAKALGVSRATLYRHLEAA